MGFAFIIFVALFAAALVIATAVMYGVAKDSQRAPLRALNDYAGIKTGQAQTGVTIVNTCLSLDNEYTDPQKSPGVHNLYLTVKNNRSTVLNSTKVTVLYNASYINFTVNSAGNVWAPLANTTLQVSNLYLDPNTPPPGPLLRLLVSAENGVVAIAPTTPTNFSYTFFDKTTGTYSFVWNASIDNMGIAYYLIYGFQTAPTGPCPITPDTTQRVNGNQTNITFIYCQSCSTTFFFMTAVDYGGNMAIQSRTFRCTGSSGHCTD